MGQVTIYVDNNIERQMRDAAKSSHLSVSKWVSKLIKNSVSTQWPQEISSLAGSWKDGYPSLEEIRADQVSDCKREKL